MLLWPRSGFFDSYTHACSPANEETDAFIPQVMRKPILHRLSPRDEFFRTFTDLRQRLRGGFSVLPMEIRDQILETLEPHDCINVVLAGFRFSDQDIEWMTHEKV